MTNTKIARKLIKILESYSESSFKELKLANPTVEIEFFTLGDFGIDSYQFENLVDDINDEFGSEIDIDDLDESTFIETILEQLE